MSRLTITIGILLVLLGLIAYAATHGVSPTALIPTGFGVLYVILGVWGVRRAAARKHVMHIAAALSLLGILGNLGAVIAFTKLLAGVHPAHPAAVISRTLMAALCLVHLLFAIRSFAVARLRPAGQA